MKDIDSKLFLIQSVDMIRHQYILHYYSNTISTYFKRI